MAQGDHGPFPEESHSQLVTKCKRDGFPKKELGRVSQKGENTLSHLHGSGQLQCGWGETGCARASEAGKHHLTQLPTATRWL